MKKSLVLLLTLTVVLALAACGNKSNNNSGNADSGEKLSGTIVAAGSTALQPLVDNVSKKFMSEHSGVQITVQPGGSGGGLTQVQAGQIEIGNSDIFAEEKFKGDDAAKAKELVDHQVGVVGIAAVTNKEAGVDSLTKEQLIDIFTGKVTNWKDVGGADQKIVLVNRPSSSGTRATFENFALGQKTEDIQGSIQEDASGTVKKLVGETPGAIGYLALSYLDDSIKAISYNGVAPTADNIAAGQYPVWAYEHMYTKGEPNATVKAFLDYMLSDEIQNSDVTEMGYIPVAKMTVARDAAGNVTNK